jgi:hypothetical protein
LPVAEIADARFGAGVVRPPEEGQSRTRSALFGGPIPAWRAQHEVPPPTEPEPELSRELLDWLTEHPERIPQSLPAGDTVGSRFGFTVRKNPWGRLRELTVTRLDPRARPVRDSVLMTTQPGFRRGSARFEGLNWDDVGLLEKQLERLRAGDPTVFAGLVACAVCGRTLSDPISRRHGIGPVCAARLGLVLPTGAKECTA